MVYSSRFEAWRSALSSRGIATGVLLLAWACNSSGTQQQARTPSGSSVSGVAAAATITITDTDIQLAVSRRLEYAGSLPATAIRVAVKDQIVTLHGKVSRGDERVRAAELAEQTRGVRAVVNLLTVNRADAPDVELAEQIFEALRRESAQDFSNVAVTVEGSRARLTGFVPRALARESAEETAWFTRGVTEVDNQIQVVPGFTRTDDELTRTIRASLRTDPYVGQVPFQVTVKDARVKLTGDVGSAFEKRRARRRALVAGVVDVDDSTVRVLPRPPERAIADPTPDPPSNAETVAAIHDAFRADPRIPEGAIHVHSNFGVVTLTGAVSTLSQKLAAAEDARSAAGVWAVLNNVQVGPGSSAGNLQQQVAHRIRQSPLISHDRLHINAERGRVILNGEVSSPFERSAAERVASTVPGVLSIDNKLRVKPSPKNARTDQQLREQIERNLWWDQRVRDTRVDVDVANGVVTLRGEVPNPEVYDAILQNVFEALPTEIRNQLTHPEPPRFAFR